VRRDHCNVQKGIREFLGDTAGRAENSEAISTPGCEVHLHQNPPFFKNIPDPCPLTDIRGARALAMLGNSIADHISPAGSIGADTPAGKWLIAQGVKPAD